ncbi:MAG: saccharopine dehydrogenase C-terminal domain-containing protein [Flavobacteriales bacterium]
MKVILIIGAGRSSASLIRYLLKESETSGWKIRVGDLDLQLAENKVNNHSNGQAFKIDLSDDVSMNREVEGADLVISMLPATMHMKVIKLCLKYKKSILTPSYIPQELWDLDTEAKNAGIAILGEMGADPGIDHMSAMRIVHEIQGKGGEITSFKSYTGGLIAPESDDNPWNYKVTWNPRNIVLAGAGATAKFRENGLLKYIPYTRLFEDIETIEVGDAGKFDGYANRDSLGYKKAYGMENVKTLLRGTLRKEGFCAAWGALVKIGLTDDGFMLEDPANTSWKDLTASFLPRVHANIEMELQRRFSFSDEVMTKLKWLGIFEEESIGINQGSPAVALQALIEKKLKLDDGDKDMIVMNHDFEYLLEGKSHKLQSSMVCIGDDTTYTAMAKTVGMPIAIAAKLMLNGALKMSGVHLPILPEIYNPVLNELELYGVHFNEKVE